MRLWVDIASHEGRGGGLWMSAFYGWAELVCGI